MGTAQLIVVINRDNRSSTRLGWVRARGRAEHGKGAIGGERPTSLAKKRRQNGQSEPVTRQVGQAEPTKFGWRVRKRGTANDITT